MTKRLKVLVSAYSCIPNRGSEPGIGWNWVIQIARFHEVFLLTQTRHKTAIDQALYKNPISNLNCVFFDLPKWARFWRKGQRGIRLHYYLWQILAYFVGKRLHRKVGFDLVHHVTFGNYWMPTFLVFLSVPYVWGPVGGGESAPANFYRTFSFRGKIYEYLRNTARWLGEHDPYVRFTAKRADIALATTPETKERLIRLGSRNVRVLSQVGMPKDEIAILKAIPSGNSNSFRLVSIGRLLHWKGFHLGLTAFAKFLKEFPASEYWFIGDGPERRHLEGLARRLSVAKEVYFWGNLPRSQVLEKLTDCDVLVHPSLHDSGGWVCLEAMAAGRPVICLDLGGPALQVAEDTGVKVPVHTPEQVVSDMADAMAQLARDPDLRQRLGEAARERVTRHFDWDKKSEEMNEIYEKVICRNAYF